MSSKKKEPKESPYLLRRVENGYMILDLSLDSKPGTVWVAKTNDEVYSLLTLLGATSIEVLTDQAAELIAMKRQIKKAKENKS